MTKKPFQAYRSQVISGHHESVSSMIQSKHKILLVDDNQDTLDFLSLNLQKEGFTITTALNAVEALSFVKRETPDLIVLDIVMPEMDGVELCHRFRENSSLDHTIIVFLTGRGENYSEIAAFDAGADDYIVKPVSIRVFLTRIRTLLKRKRTFGTVTPPRSNSLVIDKEKMITIKNGEVEHWQNIEFKLLCLLSSHPGKVFTRNEIHKHVWQKESVYNDRKIDVYIRKIRKKIGREHIATIIGRGYKFIE